MNLELIEMILTGGFKMDEQDFTVDIGGASSCPTRLVQFSSNLFSKSVKTHFLLRFLLSTPIVHGLLELRNVKPEIKEESVAINASNLDHLTVKVCHRGD